MILTIRISFTTITIWTEIFKIHKQFVLNTTKLTVQSVCTIVELPKSTPLDNMQIYNIGIAYGLDKIPNWGYYSLINSILN